MCWNSEFFSLMNVLPYDNILAQGKLKAFTDDKFSVDKIILVAFDRVENIVVEGENASNQHFLLFFQQSFLKASLPWSLKVGIV